MQPRLFMSLFISLLLVSCGEPPKKPVPSGHKGEGDATTPPDVFTEGVSLPEGDEHCPHGGTQIIQFRDKDQNERFTEGDEVLDTQYECFQEPNTTPPDSSTDNGGGAPTPVDKPVAFALGASTSASTFISIGLAGLAPAGATIQSFSVASQPQRGTVSVSGNTATYAPQNGFTGTDQFTYTATDSKGNISSPVKVNIVVGGTAALIVNNELNAAQDTIVKSILEAMGFQVRMVDDDVATVDQTSGANIVLISESAQSAKIGTKFIDLPIPMLIWDGIVARSMELIGPGTIESVADQTKMDVLANARQAANGVSGSFDFTINNAPLYYFTPAPHALRITSINGDANKPTLYLYEKGMADLTGKILPAARVGFPFLDLSLLTDDGKKILQGSIRQALAEP